MKSTQTLFRVLAVFLCFFHLSLSAAAEEAASGSGELLESCPLPDKPNIPNGRTASEEEMIKAQKKMKNYMDAGNRVLECLTEMEEAWGEAATEEQRMVVVLFHNKMVEEMEAIAELFNSAVRAFKGRR